MKFEMWEERLLRSITALSRTAHGQNEAAYDGKKPAIDLNSQALAQKTEENLRTAVRYVWDHGPFVQAGKAQVLDFMNTVASHVSQGLLPQGRGLFRIWNTREKFPEQVLPEWIAGEMEKLANTIASGINASSEDHAVWLAAYVEREIDWHINPYSDGCGRTAKILGAWILLRSSLGPAQFSDRSDYYGHMPDFSGWLHYYRKHVLSW